MLVLTRKRGEAILLENGQVRISLLEIRGDTVRIGIEAPDAVRVVREEVWLAARQNQRATEVPNPEVFDTLPKTPRNAES